MQICNSNKQSTKCNSNKQIYNSNKKKICNSTKQSANMLASFFKPELGGGLRGRASRSEPKMVQLGAAALLQSAVIDGSFVGH